MPVRPGPCVWALLLATGCAPKVVPRPARVAATQTAATAPGSKPPPVSAKPKPAPPLKGTAKLLSELDAARSIADRHARWAKREKLVLRIRHDADPRGADALAAYLAHHKDWECSGEGAHWQTEVAFALADLGDLRALPVLAERMRLDPLKIYSRGHDPRQKRERPIAARLIADLAQLHPEALAEIRAAAEQPVWSWARSAPDLPEIGLRALWAMHTTRPAIVDQIRTWADPPGPLPFGRARDTDADWSKVEVALQYAGALRDAKSWPILLQQLRRRPAGVDVFPLRLRGKLGPLEMALTELGTGAADGLWAWGDPKAFHALLQYAMSDQDEPGSRREACKALAGIATDGDAPEIAKQLLRAAHSRTKRARFRLACLVGGLKNRWLDGFAPALLGLLNHSVSPQTRADAACALGQHGLDGATQQKLEKLLADNKLRVDAALALLLGGSTDDARRVASLLSPKQAPELRRAGCFADLTDADLAGGRLYRWVDHALALSSLPGPRAVMDFARANLSRELALDPEYDATLWPPGLLTRVVLRYRLQHAADSGPAAIRPEAIATLGLMRERGTLLAIAAGTGKASKLARAELDRLSASPAPAE